MELNAANRPYARLAAEQPEEGKTVVGLGDDGEPCWREPLGPPPDSLIRLKAHLSSVPLLGRLFSTEAQEVKAYYKNLATYRDTNRTVLVGLYRELRAQGRAEAERELGRNAGDELSTRARAYAESKLRAADIGFNYQKDENGKKAINFHYVDVPLDSGRLLAIYKRAEPPLANGEEPLLPVNPQRLENEKSEGFINSILEGHMKRPGDASPFSEKLQCTRSLLQLITRQQCRAVPDGGYDLGCPNINEGIGRAELFYQQLLSFTAGDPGKLEQILQEYQHLIQADPWHAAEIALKALNDARGNALPPLPAIPGEPLASDCNTTTSASRQALDSSLDTDALIKEQAPVELTAPKESQLPIEPIDISTTLDIDPVQVEQYERVARTMVDSELPDTLFQLAKAVLTGNPTIARKSFDETIRAFNDTLDTVRQGLDQLAPKKPDSDEDSLALQNQILVLATEKKIPPSDAKHLFHALISPEGFELLASLCLVMVDEQDPYIDDARLSLAKGLMSALGQVGAQYTKEHADARFEEALLKYTSYEDLLDSEDGLLPTLRETET